MRKKMSAILEKLQGGDLRSIGRANEVAQEVEDNPALFESVFDGLTNDDPVIRMRAADVIEKVTQSKPELLFGYTSKVISLLASTEQQEVCWHMAQIAPRLKYNESQENEIIESLKSYLVHKSKIVQVSAMESLTTIAERNTAILDEMVEIITKLKETGSPAVQSRGRKLLQRLIRK
jgi:HEAT repeat protein